MWGASQENKFDLRNTKSKANEISFAKTLLNVIQSLFDSGDEQFKAGKIQNMNDTVTEFENGTIDFAMQTVEEYNA